MDLNVDYTLLMNRQEATRLVELLVELDNSYQTERAPRLNDVLISFRTELEVLLGIYTHDRQVNEPVQS